MQKISFFFVLIFLASGLQASFDDHPGKDTERSFKTGQEEPRYLSQFKLIDYDLPYDYSTLIPDIDKNKKKVLDLLNQAALSAKQFDWFTRIEDERVVLILTDLGNARFTLEVDKQKVSVAEGADEAMEPTMVVPLMTSNVADLAAYLEDGMLSYEEKYKIFYAITIPGLQAIYHNELLFGSGDKSEFKFDNLMQLVIPREEEFVIYGIPRTIEATVVNVDGQWMVFSGLQGDPDFRISCTPDQAVRLYKLAFYDVRKIKSKKQAEEVSKEFLKFMDSIVVYTREDHQ
ncbi:MAG: hypothetical protein JW801_07525 [Bacteroidales bacterium]|nr:hypothetical protein [Bacteroidales bacterium]